VSEELVASYSRGQSLEELIAYAIMPPYCDRQARIESRTSVRLMMQHCKPV
jgi:hypothetical protein